MTTETTKFPLDVWAATLPGPVKPHTARHWARTGRVVLPGDTPGTYKPGAVKLGRDWYVYAGAELTPAKRPGPVGKSP